ncbi:MAG: porin family protein [Bacteroidota bacterium]
MRKLIIIVAAAFLLVPFADAQMFNIGLKAGLGLSNLKFDDLTGIGSGSDVYQLATGDRVAAYHVGLQTRITIATFFVQPELYFNDGGGTINTIAANGASELLNVDLKTVNLPLMLGVKLGPARINVGPVGSYVLKEESIPLEIGGVIEDYTLFTSGMSWGFQAGVGVDVSKISLDVRYEGSLSALGDSFTVGGQTFNLDARPRQWVFSLGFWFR